MDMFGMLLKTALGRINVTVVKTEQKNIYLQMQKHGSADSPEVISEIKNICNIQGFERVFLRKV